MAIIRWHSPEMFDHQNSSQMKRAYFVINTIYNMLQLFQPYLDLTHHKLFYRQASRLIVQAALILFLHYTHIENFGQKSVQLP